MPTNFSHAPLTLRFPLLLHNGEIVHIKVTGETFREAVMDLLLVGRTVALLCTAARNGVSNGDRWRS